MESNYKESQNNRVGDADHITLMQNDHKEKQSIKLADTNFHETTKNNTKITHLEKHRNAHNENHKRHNRETKMSKKLPTKSQNQISNDKKDK